MKSKLKIAALAALVRANLWVSDFAHKRARAIVGKKIAAKDYYEARVAKLNDRQEELLDTGNAAWYDATELFAELTEARREAVRDEYEAACERANDMREHAHSIYKAGTKLADEARAKRDAAMAAIPTTL